MALNLQWRRHLAASGCLLVSKGAESFRYSAAVWGVLWEGTQQGGAVERFSPVCTGDVFKTVAEGQRFLP